MMTLALLKQAEIDRLRAEVVRLAEELEAEKDLHRIAAGERGRAPSEAPPEPPPADACFAPDLSPAWQEAWAMLAVTVGAANARFVGPSGEAWEYMGTFRDGAAWTHRFRHRAPPAGVLGTQAVPASDPPEDRHAPD